MLYAYPNDDCAGDSAFEPTIEDAVPCEGTEPFEELLERWLPHGFKHDQGNCCLFETEEDLREDSKRFTGFFVFTEEHLAVAGAAFPLDGPGNDSAMYACMAALKRVLLMVGDEVQRNPA